MSNPNNVHSRAVRMIMEEQYITPMAATDQYALYTSTERNECIRRMKKKEAEKRDSLRGQIEAGRRG